MSWAATRQTSRVEDMAYCLLGIFDVNMPLLYGEGPKAFIRLQEEIIRISNDHTIFCWARDSGVAQSWTSMLAPSPAAFLKSGDYVAMDAWEAPVPYSMTNLGLSIHLPVLYTLTQMVVVLDAGVSHGDPIPLQSMKGNSADHKGDESVRDSEEDEDENWDSEEEDQDDKEFSQLSYA
ncbi:hypothetical protein DL767_008250 [Monosporascus sp. MG133]|nr:hypothetical protein DL767_008250 [Monosporascus sp. MG133]